MECMEEGYLAKIVRGDGSSGIKVGEVFICYPSIDLWTMEYCLSTIGDWSNYYYLFD